MEKKKTLGYKTLLTSLVSASVFLSVSAQEVSATEENINEKEVYNPDNIFYNKLVHSRRYAN